MTGGGQSGDAVRFGRTVLRAVAGRLVDQPAEAIVVSANARGMLGMGGVRLAAGAEVEREAMAAAPLAVGSAIVTGPGLLAGRAVRAIIHCVVAERLGQPARPDDIRRAVPAALRLAEARRFSTLALPLVGAGDGPDQLGGLAVAAIVVEEVVAHLRRVSSRIESVALVGPTDDDVATLRDVLRVAREQAWELPR